MKPNFLEEVSCHTNARDPAVDGVVRFTADRPDQRVIEARFGHLFRARAIQTAWRTGLCPYQRPPRSIPVKDKRIIEAFKKTSPTRTMVHIADLPAGNAGGDLVPGRSTPWPEEWPDAPVDKNRRPRRDHPHSRPISATTQRPTIWFPRHLSGSRQGRRRSCAIGRTRKPCRCSRRGQPRVARLIMASGADCLQMFSSGSQH